MLEMKSRENNNNNNDNISVSEKNLLWWRKVLDFDIPLKNIVVNCVSIDPSHGCRLHNGHKIIDQDPRSGIYAKHLQKNPKESWDNIFKIKKLFL
jgi:hypothetical protein